MESVLYIDNNHPLLGPKISPPSIQQQSIAHGHTNISITTYNYTDVCVVIFEGAIDSELTIPIEDNCEYYSLAFIHNGKVTTSSHHCSYQNTAASGCAYFCCHKHFKGSAIFSPCDKLQIASVCFKKGFMAEFDTLHSHGKTLDAYGFQHIAMQHNVYIQRCVENLFSIPVNEAIKPTFIQGKAYELAALCAQLLFSDIHRCSGITDNALQRAHETRDILEKNLQNPPKTHELAQLVGTNECSLKKEFKAVFDISPYAYVIQRRMENAYQEILHSNLPITTIAQNHGYNNTSNFSSTFFKHYGVKPGGLKLQRKSTQAS